MIIIQMLPDRCIINLAAIEDVSYKKSKINFWDNVYGIDMTCMKQSVLQEPLVDICDKKAINSSVARILEIDLYTVTKEELDFSNQYEITFFRRDTLNALVCWFDCFFDKLPNKVHFSTGIRVFQIGPFTKSTHWKQVVFYTEKDVKVEKGDVLKGSIAVRKAVSNPRELDVKISFHIKGKYDNWDSYQLFKLK